MSNILSVQFYACEDLARLLEDAHNVALNCDLAPILIQLPERDDVSVMTWDEVHVVKDGLATGKVVKDDGVAPLDLDDIPIAEANSAMHGFT
jgi:hypothetical protein